MNSLEYVHSFIFGSHLKFSQKSKITYTNVVDEKEN